MNNIGLECIKQKLIMVNDQLAHIKANADGVKAQTLEKAIGDLDAVIQYIKFTMDKELKVKYWAGLLNSDNMKRPEWLQQWIEMVEEEKQDGYELVVFRLPIGKNLQPDYSAVEKFLQEKYGE